MMKFLRGEDKVSALIITALAVIFAVLIVLILPGLLPPSNPESLWPSIIFPLVFFGAFIIVAVAWGLIAGKPVVTAGPSVLKSTGLGLATGLGGLSVCVAYAALAGTLTPAKSSGDLPLLLLGTVLVFYQSAAEEIYFRGWIQPVLNRNFGPWVGVFVSALLFALLHVLAGAVASPVSFVNVTLAGGLFGLLAWRTGGLAAPVMAHFAWNWAESLLFGLAPNPGTDVWTAFVDFDLTGSGLWGGSDEGLNASLAVTFVLVALCLPLVLWRAPNPAPATV